MGKKAKRRLFYGGSVTAAGLLAGVYLIAAPPAPEPTSTRPRLPRSNGAR